MYLLYSLQFGTNASKSSANLAALAVDKKVHRVVVEPAAFLERRAEQACRREARRPLPAQIRVKRIQSPRKVFSSFQRLRRWSQRLSKPATVPPTLTALSVPGSTTRAVVIIRGRPPSTWHYLRRDGVCRTSAMRG